MPVKKDTNTCVYSWWSMLDQILSVHIIFFFFASAVYTWLISAITEKMLVQIVKQLLHILILSHSPFPNDLASLFFIITLFLCEALNE